MLAGSAGGAPGDATATKVAEIRAVGESVPASLFNAGGTLLFSAADGTNGDELWKSNGGPLGAGGTEMVANINPSSQGSGPTNFAIVDGTVFFSANDGTSMAPGFHGREMWKIEPPYTTPVLVEDINATANGVSSSPEQFTNVSGTVFFVANDGVSGDELWKSMPPYDAGSTSLVEDINQTPTPAASSTPEGLTEVNGTLFFAADDGASGYELWKSTDGTPGGTTLVANINPTASMGSDPDFLTDVNGTLLFAASDGATTGRELWKSNGGPLGAGGTEPVENIAAGSAGSDPMHLADVNGTLFFQANDTGSNQELWKSVAPHTPGTTEIIDLNASSGSAPTDLVNIGGTLYFRATGDTGGTELWKSDGGPLGAGTVMVADINPAGGSSPAEMTGVGGQIFFRAAQGGINDNELWKTTGVGATMVADIDQNPATGSGPAALTEVSGVLFFRADDIEPGANRELWKATIEPVPPATPGAPPNTFSVGALKGTKLTLNVDAAGTATVDDRGAKSAGRARAAAKKKKKSNLLRPSSASGGPGKIVVPLKLTKQARAKLKRKGKLTIKGQITFTPTGGTANTQAAKLKLKGKKKK